MKLTSRQQGVAMHAFHIAAYVFQRDSENVDLPANLREQFKRQSDTASALALEIEQQGDPS